MCADFPVWDDKKITSKTNVFEVQEKEAAYDFWICTS